jgi:thiamine biosynthesis lipoprotein
MRFSVRPFATLPFTVLFATAACDRAPSPASAPPSSVSSATSAGSAAEPTGSSAAAASASAAGPAPEPFTAKRITVEGKAMGTKLAFAVYTTPTLDETKVRRAIDDAIAEIVRLENLMTTWREDAELSRVNAAAGKNPVKVSQETFDIVKESIHASEISEGTFDITFESLHGLWKFDQDLDPHPPTEAQVRAKLSLVNYRHIKLDEADRSIYLDKAGVRISLGGIAKGYAVDRAVKVLEDAGLKSFYVQAGGDLFARGKKPEGGEWSAGIRDPRGPGYFAVLPLSDHAFSTAGDYERSYVVGGKRYHHIIDPRTGFPATACRSVTIWAPTALLADEIDDAVFILGPEKGLKLVESIDGLGAVIVDAKNNLHVSKRLQGKLVLTAAPTDAP